MTGFDARLRRLEKLSAQPQPHSPAEAWAAIYDWNGTADLVEGAISPLLPQLQSSLLVYSHRVLDRRRGGDAPPYCTLCIKPVPVLAEIIAHPPGEPVDDILFEYRKPLRYNPDLWLKLDPGIPGHLLSYEQSYAQWLVRKITWLICPEPDALSLRQRLHNHPPPPDLELIEPDQLSIDVWPEGIFRLLNIPMTRESHE